MENIMIKSKTIFFFWKKNQILFIFMLLI